MRQPQQLLLPAPKPVQQPAIDPLLLKKIYTDRDLRITLARQSHWWFFNIYFSEYLQSPAAEFQKELFALTERNIPETIVIMAFRGSAKSTICNLSYALWSILGVQQKKFVVLLSFNQVQARQHLGNIKRQLESNELLASDFGSFFPSDDEWAASSLVLPKYGAKLLAASFDQNIRGMRFNQFRPDLIIADDVEDAYQVRSREGRDKTFQWFTRDILPLGDQQTKIMVLGTMLHEDCLLMRLGDSIKAGDRKGICRRFPFLNKDGKPLWPGKFPNPQALSDLKRKIGDERAWQQEYLLKIIPDDYQVIKLEWIKYYDELPPVAKKMEFHGTATGVDLAISLKESADYTAMVSCRVYGSRENFRVYILPNPVNERLTSLQTIQRIKAVDKAWYTAWGSYVYVEDVGYQGSIVEQLRKEGVHAEGVKVFGQDKRSRLASISHMVEAGKVLFPKTGCERLIEQLTHLGLEDHDDLADAFSMVLSQVMEFDQPMPQVRLLG